MAIDFTYSSAYTLPPASVSSARLVEYSPDSLLDVSGLAPAVTACHLFWECCERGYTMYFGDAETHDDVVYESGPHAVVTVIDAIIQSVGAVMRRGCEEAFVQMVGVGVGWLSALHQVQATEAAMGMYVLLSLVNTAVTAEVVRLSSPQPRRAARRVAARTVGGDGWPLDM